jgi:hypothetical protein
LASHYSEFSAQPSLTFSAEVVVWDKIVEESVVGAERLFNQASKYDYAYITIRGSYAELLARDLLAAEIYLSKYINPEIQIQNGSYIANSAYICALGSLKELFLICHMCFLVDHAAKKSKGILDSGGYTWSRTRMFSETLIEFANKKMNVLLKILLAAKPPQPVVYITLWQELFPFVFTPPKYDCNYEPEARKLGVDNWLESVGGEASGQLLFANKMGELDQTTAIDIRNLLFQEGRSRLRCLVEMFLLPPHVN